MPACDNPDCRCEFNLPSGRGGQNQRFCCLRCRQIQTSREFRATHPSSNRDRCRKYYNKHKAKRKEADRAYRQRIGRAALNIKHKYWRQTTTLKYWRAALVRERSKIQTPIEDRITELEWKYLLEAWENRCAYCGTSAFKLTQDHVMPLSKGGLHTMDNIVPACLSCNSSKRDKSVEDFEEWLRLHPPIKAGTAMADTWGGLEK